MYVCMYLYTGLEIGGIASQNANHFCGNCESFGKMIRNIANKIIVLV